MTIDDQLMEKFGYKQELKRALGPIANFAFGFTEVAVLASLVQVFGNGLYAGGPPLVIWGWIVTSIITVGPIAFSMAEICSAFPSAGSVYHWAGQLPSPEYKNLASYCTGWFNFLGNAAGDAAFAFGFAALLSSCCVVSGGSLLSIDSQVGIAIGIVFLWSVLNLYKIEGVGWINSFAAVWQIGTIFAIAIACLATTPELNTAEYVFVNTAGWNETGFTSVGYIIAVGMLTSLFGFAGYEASAHMAEEAANAHISAARGLIATCAATSLGGFVVILSILFSMQNPNPSAVTVVGMPLHPTPSTGTTTYTTTNPAMATSSTTGLDIVDCIIYCMPGRAGIFLTWAILINLFFAGVSSVTVTSRITFALIRDRAFPFSQHLEGVTKKHQTPAKAIFLVFILDALILLLPLTNPTNGLVAFSAITGLATIGFQVSYGIPIFLRVATASGRAVMKNSPGFFSRYCAIPSGIIASIWLFGTSVFLFFPIAAPVDDQNMNYVCVVVGGVVIMMALYWVLGGRTRFNGPRPTVAFFDLNLKGIPETPMNEFKMVSHVSP